MVLRQGLSASGASFGLRDSSNSLVFIPGTLVHIAFGLQLSPRSVPAMPMLGRQTAAANLIISGGEGDGLSVLGQAVSRNSV